MITPERNPSAVLRLIAMHAAFVPEAFFAEWQFTAEEILQIWRMLTASQWTYYPHEWSDQQVIEALAGYPPHFNALDNTPITCESPQYPHKRIPR